MFHCDYTGYKSSKKVLKFQNRCRSKNMFYLLFGTYFKPAFKKLC